jgi:hypothetical protein
MKAAFHRIGIVLAAIPALMALGRFNATDESAHRDAVLIVLVGCGGIYLLATAIGWIVASLTGHNERLSK